MPETYKPHLRKRTVTGWRQLERRRQEIRSKYRQPPTPAKPEA